MNVYQISNYDDIIIWYNKWSFDKWMIFPLANNQQVDNYLYGDLTFYNVTMTLVTKLWPSLLQVWFAYFALNSSTAYNCAWYIHTVWNDLIWYIYIYNYIYIHIISIWSLDPLHSYVYIPTCYIYIPKWSKMTCLLSPTKHAPQINHLTALNLIWHWSDSFWDSSSGGFRVYKPNTFMSKNMQRTRQNGQDLRSCF